MTFLGLSQIFLSAVFVGFFSCAIVVFAYLRCPTASFYRDLGQLRWVTPWQSAQSVIRFSSTS